MPRPPGADLGPRRPGPARPAGAHRGDPRLSAEIHRPTPARATHARTPVRRGGRPGVYQLGLISFLEYTQAQVSGGEPTTF
ncbi:sugar ABC transporter permease, partial [Streptomyces ardesiacus]